MTEPTKSSLASLRLWPEPTSALGSLANWRPVAVLPNLPRLTDQPWPKAEPVLGALEAYRLVAKAE